jgi:putative ABC transport system ATP-binding protein
MASPLLALQNVSKIYTIGDQTLFALCQVNVKIYEGEFVAIVGPSGSGKSTFLHVASLLDKPTEGSILIKNKNVTDYTEPETAKLRNREIGFVFQQFNLLAKTSAQENVALPLVYTGISEKVRMKRSKDKLIEVGLGDRLNNSPSQLSGGQQQRVAIARALVTDPAIIFADEPTGNLDSKSGQEIVKMIIKLNNSGKTVVLVTHDLSMAQIAKRIIMIADGRINSDELTKWGKKDKKVYGKWPSWKTEVDEKSCRESFREYASMRGEE